MRGKGVVKHGISSYGRITPAYAGKSRIFALAFGLLEDHPRVCGEKMMKLTVWPLWAGSPPRMRGKAEVEEIFRTALRITPAYAGKSTGPQRPRAAPQDHPRVCGEKHKKCPLTSVIWGSPPRMRGKEINFCTILVKMGITPAYAGKSIASCS